MADEAATPSTQAAEAPTQSEAPTDFREYAAWRATGELPQKDEPPAAPAAAEAEQPPPATTAPDSEPDEDQEQDTQENAKPGSRRSRKIERLIRENAEMAMRIAQLAQKPAAEEPKQAAPQAEGKPKLEDFQTLEEFQEALTDWKLDQREKTKAEADARRAHDEAAKAAFEDWAKREKAAKRAHDDYEDVLDSVTIPDGPGVQAARQAMLESEHGAEVLYHLAKHPAELKRIAALSPVSAVREVGKLEAALAKPTAPENGTPKITGAPKPPPPTGRPSKTTSDTPEEAAARGDFRAYARLRMAQGR